MKTARHAWSVAWESALRAPEPKPPGVVMPSQGIPAFLRIVSAYAMYVAIWSADFPFVQPQFSMKSELRCGYGHGGQRAGAYAIRAEHRADATDRTGRLQALQARDHVPLGDAQTTGDVGVWRGRQREVALEFIEQAAVDVIERRAIAARSGFTARWRDAGLQFDLSVHRLTYCPIRWARAVKKMPLGALAGSCAIRAKLCVS